MPMGLRRVFHKIFQEDIMDLQPADMDDLKRAKAMLENPGLAIKITHLLGIPIEKGFKLLPDDWNLKVLEITRTALIKAIQLAVATMKDAPNSEASNNFHKIAVAATGSIGGFFGMATFAMELPVSTTIMLRSIMDIARSQGEHIHDVETKIACMEVFAMGGANNRDNAAETGYFAVRAALARSVANAAQYIAEKGLAEEGAPALVRLIVTIAQRFSIQVSEKAAAQAAPAIGAAGGALINTLFLDHFQDMACGHFIIRRLERKYGSKAVEESYNAIL
jgi:hypothetical protein